MMPFTRLAMAPDPWLEQVVLIGGWCHSLYRRHPDAQELDYPPLLTLDTDIAIPPRLSAGKRDIRSRFLDHGFTEEFFGDDRPPATHYRLGDSASGFYVEFLTPLTGGNLDRKGGRKAMIEVAGIAAQRLPMRSWRSPAVRRFRTRVLPRRPRACAGISSIPFWIFRGRANR